MATEQSDSGTPGGRQGQGGDQGQGGQEGQGDQQGPGVAPVHPSSTTPTNPNIVKKSWGGGETKKNDK